MPIWRELKAATKKLPVKFFDSLVQKPGLAGFFTGTTDKEYWDSSFPLYK
jgi:hypothetical protein